MIPYVESDQFSELEKYLETTFGSHQECLCGHCAPPIGAIIEVVETIQCCDVMHPDFNIEPGKYRISEIEAGMTSHYMRLVDIETGAMWCRNIGYSYQICVDWRGVLNADPAALATATPPT